MSQGLKREEQVAEGSEGSPTELRRASEAEGRWGRVERWSLKKKAAVALRLLRGEDLETVSREVRVAVPRLIQWRDAFLHGGMEGLKARRGDPLHKQLRAAQAKIGELSMKLELWEKRGSQLGLSKRSEP